MSDNPIRSQPLSRQGRENYDLIFRKPKAEFVATISHTPDGLFRCTLSNHIEPSIWMKAIEAREWQDLLDMMLYEASKRKWLLHKPVPGCPSGYCDGYGYARSTPEIHMCGHGECRKVAEEIAETSPTIEYRETT